MTAAWTVAWTVAMMAQQSVDRLVGLLDPSTADQWVGRLEHLQAGAKAATKESQKAV